METIKKQRSEEKKPKHLEIRKAYGSHVIVRKKPSSKMTKKSTHN